MHVAAATTTAKEKAYFMMGSERLWSCFLLSWWIQGKERVNAPEGRESTYG